MFGWVWIQWAFLHYSIITESILLGKYILLPTRFKSPVVWLWMFLFNFGSPSCPVVLPRFVFSVPGEGSQSWRPESHRLILKLRKQAPEASHFPGLSQWLLLIHMKTKEILFSCLEACGEDSGLRSTFYVFSSQAGGSKCFLENTASGQRLWSRITEMVLSLLLSLLTGQPYLLSFHFLNPFK